MHSFPVTSSFEDGIGRIELNDTASRNAISHRMSNAIAEAVASLLDTHVQVIVLTASAPVFSAGGSLDDLLSPPGPLSAAYRGLHSLANCPVPTIAAVGGPAIGAGVSLPLACDVILVSPAARFDPRFLDIAIHPGGAHLWHLSRRVGYQGAAAMVLMGDVLDGEEAVRAGLAWRCVPAPALVPTAMSLAKRVVGRPPGLVALTKTTLRQTIGLVDPVEAERLELGAQEWSVAQPEHIDAVQRLKKQIKDHR